MQSLYGYFTTRESYKKVMRDRLQLEFTPDPLTHDMSDTEELDSNRKSALRLFDENLEKGSLEANSSVEEDVFDAVSKAISSYYSDMKAERIRIKKSMLSETRRIQDLYEKFLLLPGEFQFIEKLDQEKRETARVKKQDSWKYNLQHNPIIEAIQSNTVLQAVVTSKKLSWQSETDQLKSWYKHIFKNDERFNEYQVISDPSIDDHKGVLKHLYKNLLLKTERIANYFEEQDISWMEDSTIIRTMLTKTIQDYNPDQKEPIQLKKISINEEDDFEFFETIYDATLQEDERLEKLIGEKTKNWDVNRLAKTDIVILKMALAEIIHCRSIPTKVTINEFIEICKLYSTPKSKQFVNGILDVLANQLTSEGVIKKTGRGLIDNK